MGDQYDRIFKEQISKSLPHFLNLISGTEFEGIEEVNVEIATTLAAKPDFLHKVRTADGEEALLHMEIQSHMPKAFPKRMLLYQALLSRKFPKLNIYQYAVYIGEKKHRVKPKIEHPQGWFYQYGAIDLKNIDYQVFLASERPEEVLFASIAHIPENLYSAVVKRLIRKLRSLVKDWDSFAGYLQQLAQLSYLRKDLVPVIEEFLSEEKMPIIITKEQMDAAHAISPLYQRGQKEGIEKGIEKGMQSKTAAFAQKLLTKGYDLEEIAELTELSIEEVRAIKTESGRD